MTCECGHHKEDHAGIDVYGKCVIVDCKCEEFKAK